MKKRTTMEKIPSSERKVPEVRKKKTQKKIFRNSIQRKRKNLISMVTKSLKSKAWTGTKWSRKQPQMTRESDSPETMK